MPIEFHCTGCGKLLRTADETAGREARCPACGTVTNVPEQPAMSQESVAPAAAEDSLFGSMESAEDFGAEVNPYQAPLDASTSSPFASAVPPIERVCGPAICLIVMGSLGLVAYLGITILYGSIFVMVLCDPELQGHPEDAYLGFGILIGVGILGTIIAILTIVGGIKMKNLRGYGLAMTCTVFLLLPGFPPCCGIGIPFGIWALVVLVNSEVREAFQ